MLSILLFVTVALAGAAVSQPPEVNESGEGAAAEDELPRINRTGEAIILENDLVTVRFPGPSPHFTITPKSNATSAAEAPVPFSVRYDRIVEYEDVNGDGEYTPDTDPVRQALNVTEVDWDANLVTGAEEGVAASQVALGLKHNGTLVGENESAEAEVEFYFALYGDPHPLPVAGEVEFLTLAENEMSVRFTVLAWDYADEDNRLALTLTPAPDAHLARARVDPVDEGIQAWVSTEETLDTGLGHVVLAPKAYAMEPAAGNASIPDIEDWRPHDVTAVFHGEDGIPVLVVNFGGEGNRMISHGQGVGPYGSIEVPQEAGGGVPLEGAPIWFIFLLGAVLLAFLMARRAKMRGPEGPE